jgi:hypothetical protein
MCLRREGRKSGDGHKLGRKNLTIYEAAKRPVTNVSQVLSPILPIA